MAADMTITLDGQHGEISATSLHTALGCTLQLLKETGGALGATGGRWAIGDLRAGSAVFALDNPAAPGAATLVMTGLKTLAKRPMIPLHWNQTMVRKARDLGRLAGTGGVRGVSVATPEEPVLRLTPAFTANAEQAIQARDVSLGSVQGVVDKWDERRGHQIGLTLGDGETITASYSSELGDRILREALGHEIEARGELRRNAEGQRVQLLIHDFTVLSTEWPLGIEVLAGLYRELGDAGVTVTDVLDHRE